WTACNWPPTSICGLSRKLRIPRKLTLIVATVLNTKDKNDVQHEKQQLKTGLKTGLRLKTGHRQFRDPLPL
ncbi:unnamed protein product, partial [Amoebophrya sp. A25]